MGVAAKGPGGAGVLEGALLVTCGVRQRPGFRVEGVVRRDPEWPALAQSLSELARVALWLAPWVRVELVRLLGRCTVLAKRVFAAAEDGGTGEIVTRFWGVLGDMIEDAFESLAHLGTSLGPRRRPGPRRYCVRGWGTWGIVLSSPSYGTDSSPRVCRRDSEGYAYWRGRVKGKGPETEVMLEVLRGQGFFFGGAAPAGRVGGSQLYPFCHSQE